MNSDISVLKMFKYYYRRRCSKYRPHIFKLERNGDSLLTTAVFFVTHSFNMYLVEI